MVRDAFEQMPMVMTALAGPDHRVAAVNAAFRAFTGRDDVIGMAYRDAFPEIGGQQLHELLDRVYRTGQRETGREWRAQFNGPGGPQEVYADFTAVPRLAADGTINGLLVVCTDVTSRVAERQAARQDAAEAERRYVTARAVVTELQEALLPTGLPVLPEARFAARYLVAGHEQAAGGDWFDAIPLPDGTVALLVGDVVGHGVAASAAMGQVRAVLAELLTAETSLERVLERADAFAAQNPALRAATLALAVLDPVDGKFCYATCGHPPPLIVSSDGKTRFLDGTGTGPLGTGSAPILASGELRPGELLLLYSDGLIERPHRTITEGMAELAEVAGDAAAGRALPMNASPAASERVCELTVELLTRTGYADDVTALAVQRLAEPVPPLRLELPGIRPSLTRAREEFGAWLKRLDVAAEDAEALHLAMVEVFTNAIEHAYPQAVDPGPADREPAGRKLIELTAALGEDGFVECRITDHGTWQPPDPAEADRGHGLMVAGHVVDSLQVSHADGTTVVMRHRLRRPAILASSHPSSRPATYPAEPPFGVDTLTGPGGGAHAQVRGAVNITTADLLTRRLLAASRGGTVPLTADLTGVTQLASAGVSALYLVRAQLAAHEQNLVLITAPDSVAAMVLDLVRLPHTAG